MSGKCTTRTTLASTAATPTSTATTLTFLERTCGPRCKSGDLGFGTAGTGRGSEFG